MQKIIDVVLAPFAWLDMTEYDDGTKVTPEDRLVYQIASLCVIVLTLGIVAAILFGFIL